MQRLQNVLIVGAGPSGLTMAAELHRHGISFRIIDKHTKPVSTSNALAVQCRTLEVWDDMGLLDDAMKLGHVINGLIFYSGSEKIFELDLRDIGSDYPYILGLAQHDTESLLLSHLQLKNITVEMETEIVDLKEENNQVKATLKSNKADQEIINFDWVIACDGGHSFVREKLKISFQGKELPQHFVFADVEIHSSLTADKASVIAGKDGIMMFAPYDKKYWRVIAEVSRDKELSQAKSLTTSQIKRLIKARCNFDIEVGEAIWTSGFWIHEKIISEYQHKQIFFVGDAAHIHSPVGGQGMNTGIQDAYNLAWKLALVIKQQAKPIILESYHKERYKVAKEILKNTTAMTKIVTVHISILRVIRNFILKLIMRFPTVQKAIAENLSELMIRYESDLVLDLLPHSEGPKAGMRALDVKLGSHNGRLFDYVHGISWVLLIFSGKKRMLEIEKIMSLKKSLNTLYDGSLLKFVLVTEQNNFPCWDALKINDPDLLVHSCYGAIKPTLYLIRPDKYVGFRGGMNNILQLHHYLSQILKT